MLAYIIPPLIIFILFSLGTKWPPTFNRIDAIILTINEIFNLKFMDNYIHIYNQLKIIESTITGANKWKNLIEIVRHYMLIIYLIGLLESFIKALFPLYLIPLIFGFYHSRNRNGIFILLLVISYLLMCYYHLIRMDDIRSRFLITPAFLLCPWIGFGIDRLYIYVKGLSRRRLFTILLVIIFALVPVYRSLRSIRKQDTVLLRAGNWIAAVPQFQAAEIITTDRRVAFYAGRGADFVFYPESDYFKMETFAAKEGMDLLIVKTSKKKKNQTPRFRKYRKVEEFVGVKDIVSIYCSPRLYGTVKGKI
jgi:hypothetical protein